MGDSPLEDDLDELDDISSSSSPSPTPSSPILLTPTESPGQPTNQPIKPTRSTTDQSVAMWGNQGGWAPEVTTATTTAMSSSTAPGFSGSVGGFAGGASGGFSGGWAGSQFSGPSSSGFQPDSGKPERFFCVYYISVYPKSSYYIKWGTTTRTYYTVVRT